MKRKTLSAAIASAVALPLMLTGCVGGGDAAGGGGGAEDRLTIWHFESEESAMGQAWARAVEIFREENPDVEVVVEQQTFEGIQRNAQIVLTGDDVPDVLLYNRGNATAGQLAAQGLIRPITDVVRERGWDEVITGNLQVTSLYDENGIMGSGDWFGVPNVGEFVGIYYNQDMFDAAGVSVPATIDELEAVMQAFVDQGITPMATAGSEHPLGQVWYSLVLHYADQQLVMDYQFFENDVDFLSPAMVQGTERLASWIDRGFIAGDAVALQAEDMGLSFINETFPMMLSGSWWFGRLINQMDANWGQFLFPGNEFHLGSASNLWTIPTNAENPGNAAEFIDITLRPEVQNVFAEAGGLPIASDERANVTDPRTIQLIENFQSISGGIAFYPDWPVAGFSSVLVSELQALMNGSKSVTEVLETMSSEYFSRRDAH